MHIEKEFLYSDANKFVTIPLIKTNYGFSSVSPGDDADTMLVNTSTARAHDLLVIVPVDSSAVIYLMDRDADKVAAIRSTSPGETSLTLPLTEFKRYWIYVASKEYVNGYVRSDNTVQPNVSTQDRQTFTYEQQRDSLNLGAPSAMTLATDTGDTRQWYASDVYYDSPNLVWYLPSTNTALSSLENSWLIYRQGIYTTISNMLQQEDIFAFTETSQSNTVAKSKVIKTFKIMSDIAEFMQDNRRRIDDAVGQEDAEKLAMVWDFLNAQLPGYGSSNDNPEYYKTYDLNLHNKLDLLGVHGDHVNMAQWDSTANQALEYNGLHVAGTNTTQPGYAITQEAMWNGLYQGGLDLRSFIKGRWANLPWHADDGFITWWPTYRAASEHYKNYYQQTISGYNTTLGSLDMPIQSHVPDQHLTWWASYIELAKSAFNNLQTWLNAESANGWNDMIAAGPQLWPIGSAALIGSGPMRPEYTTGATPTFMKWEMVPQEQRSLIPTFLSEQDMRAMDQFPEYEQRRDWVWYFLKLNNWVPMDYSSWDSTRPYDVALSGVGLSRVYPAFGIREDEWIELRDWITLNRDQLWTITYGLTGVTLGETQNLAHNAVLQNIRFLRTLLEQVDDNLWATVNNTSVILLNEFLTLASAFRTQVAANTIVNLTSTNFADGVDVMYAKEGLSNLPGWQIFTDRTPINSNLKTVRTLTLNDPVFSEVGRHLIQVHPARVPVNVRSYNAAGVIHIPDSLNSYPQTPNYFYGWNIQFESLDGRELGSQKVVVASAWNADGHFLQVSPFIDGDVVAINDEVRARIWSNAFVPVLVSINIVEQNALTLSYALYGDREFNTETGKAIIYDYTGRPFRTLTYGKLETDASNRDEIEFRYRTPSEDPGRFLDGASWNDDVRR